MSLARSATSGGIAAAGVAVLLQLTLPAADGPSRARAAVSNHGTSFKALCLPIDGGSLQCGAGDKAHIRLAGIRAADVTGPCSPGAACTRNKFQAQKRALAMFAGEPLTISLLQKSADGHIIAVVRNALGLNASCFMLRYGANYRRSLDERDLIARECRQQILSTSPDLA